MNYFFHSIQNSIVKGLTIKFVRAANWPRSWSRWEVAKKSLDVQSKRQTKKRAVYPRGLRQYAIYRSVHWCFKIQLNWRLQFTYIWVCRMLEIKLSRELCRASSTPARSSAGWIYIITLASPYHLGRRNTVCPENRLKLPFVIIFWNSFQEKRKKPRGRRKMIKGWKILIWSYWLLKLLRIYLET